MIEVRIDMDTKEIERKLGALSKKANLVMARAANTAAVTARKTLAKETAKRYRVGNRKGQGVNAVKDIIEVKKAYQTNPVARVVATGKHFNLIGFKVSPGRPVKTKTLKSGKRRNDPYVYRAAVMTSRSPRPLQGERKPFVAVMENGYEGVFRRKNEKGRALVGVGGPAIPQVMKNREILLMVNKDAGEMLRKRVDHEVGRILDSAGK